MDHKLLEISNPGEAGFPEKVNLKKIIIKLVKIRMGKQP